VRSEWVRADRRFTLAVTIPPNTTAEVRVPVQAGQRVIAPGRARFDRVDAGYAVYRVPPGTYTFATVAR